MAKLNPNLWAQMFPSPKVSRFETSRQVEDDAWIGRLIPGKWDIVSFGDSYKSHSMHKLRLNPMLAPNYTNMYFSEHGAVIPLRSIMPDYEAKFNYAKNRDGAKLPYIRFEEILKVYEKLAERNMLIQDSLFDKLGFPVFADIYKVINPTVANWVFLNPFGNATQEILPWDWIPNMNELTDLITNTGIEGNPTTMSITFSYRGEDVQSGFTAFWNWLFEKAFGITYSSDGTGFVYVDGGAYVDQQVIESLYYNLVNEVYMRDSSENFSRIRPYTELLKAAGFNTTVAAVDAYLNALFLVQVTNALNPLLTIDAEDTPYTLLPLLAYHRFVADWNLNSNITDTEAYIAKYVYGLADIINNIVGGITVSDDDLRTAFFPARRLWNYDYFTSLLPSSTTDNNIEIPANATVIDLAKLSAFQRVVLRLSYSTRYRDVIWNVFKIRPSDARLNQSSVVYERNFPIGIGEDIQTSETTFSSVLGSFSGKAYSSGRNNSSFHILAEEPCICMNFWSLMVESSYMDACDPLIHIDDIWDFPIPDTDVLGNQPIKAEAVTGNPVDQHILGYGRQYYEWLANFSTVRGRMRTSLDYWHLARRFENGAYMNEDFLTINENDDINRIFSVGDSPHGELSIYYKTYVTRPVHRSVRVLI